MVNPTACPREAPLPAGEDITVGGDIPAEGELPAGGENPPGEPNPKWCPGGTNPPGTPPRSASAVKQVSSATTATETAAARNLEMNLRARLSRHLEQMP